MPQQTSVVRGVGFTGLDINGDRARPDQSAEAIAGLKLDLDVLW
jgi:hypothetical protein